MSLIVAALALWCAVSVLVGLALGRLLRSDVVELPECPPDARALTDAEPASALAAR